jgi:uncharacterized membrane protein YjdF
VLKSSLNGDSLPAELTSKRVSVITARNNRKYISYIVAQIVSVGTCFVCEARYPVTAMIYLLISLSLPSNCSTRYNTHTVGPENVYTVERTKYVLK